MNSDGELFSSKEYQIDEIELTKSSIMQMILSSEDKVFKYHMLTKLHLNQNNNLADLEQKLTLLLTNLNAKKNAKDETFTCFQNETANLDQFPNETQKDNISIFDNSSLNTYSNEVDDRDFDFDFFDDNRLNYNQKNEKNELEFD
jgi:hypothetical protein